MNFIEELTWRGMLQDTTPGLEEVFKKGPVTGYIGFDPTAPSLTIGNYVQVMILSFFQRTGNRPIVLMGGATGRVGDPSGKDQERQLKSFEELDTNLSHQVEQFKQLLDFEGPQAARVINNLDFYSSMNVLDFLRTVGKTLTVNYMSSKESVRKRIETGISFTEFSYQLLQAYDFQCLFEQENCILQMGGSDQWGNITSGTEFIRRNLSKKAYAMTTPLLTKADGKKFGKSEEGNIWLGPKMTSPYKFYQFWINTADADLGKLLRYFSFREKEDIESLEAAENPQEQKRLLAEELTKRIHGEAAFNSVQNVSQLLFNRKAGKEELLKMQAEELSTVAEEIPSYPIKSEVLKNRVNIVDLLAEHTTMLSSKGEARKAIMNNAISVNKEKITSHEAEVIAEQLLHGKFLMIENGKKNKFMLIAE